MRPRVALLVVEEPLGAIASQPKARRGSARGRGDFSPSARVWRRPLLADEALLRKDTKEAARLRAEAGVRGDVPLGVSRTICLTASFSTTLGGPLRCTPV